MSTTTIILGATIRPQSAPSAIIVTQVLKAVNIKTRAREDHFTLRFSELIAARTPYTKIAERLGQIVTSLHTQAAQHKARVIMYVDVTALGQPVIDLIKAKADPIITCYMNKSDKRTEHDNRVTIGKAWLITRLQVLFQGQRISMPKTAVNNLLMEEVMNYSLDPSPLENELTSSFVIGTQDELLTALGLSCQGVPESEQAADEFLEYMRNRVSGYTGSPKATADWLREYSGPSAVKALDPLTGLPAPIQPDPILPT